jgi:hypothetical protein
MHHSLGTKESRISVRFGIDFEGSFFVFFLQDMPSMLLRDYVIHGTIAPATTSQLILRPLRAGTYADRQSITHVNESQGTSPVYWDSPVHWASPVHWTMQVLFSSNPDR